MYARKWIDDHGGPSAVARALERTPGSVLVWKHRNRLPRSAWPEIIAAFPDTDMEALLKIEQADAEAA